ncbi:MAG: DUF4124 domain-containing protein [Acidovorax soli]|uniref:DUF4124 domain-containing protein n=2 Tax=Comamonadaceae TaxID=80864 RepID=UPI0026EDB6FC|nr:DUF4124 domain-containing protein [Acidovorax soli]MCM2346845.1 DUF4124 domain-containing protein [Acidovorax soli]
MSKLAWIMGVGVVASVAAQCAWAQQTNGGSIYTCVDRQGRRLTADRPIAECLDREQRELGPMGTVRRQIGPSLTEKERAALEVQRRKEAEERARQQEERRRERVLTARYPDKAAHDVERASAIQLLEDVTAVAEKRVVELQQQRKALENEMEFYQRDPAKAPMALRSKIAENDAGMEEQRRFVLNQKEEKRRIHQRYDAELAQLRRLWAAQIAPAAAASDVLLPASKR